MLHTALFSHKLGNVRGARVVVCQTCGEAQGVKNDVDELNFKRAHYYRTGHHTYATQSVPRKWVTSERPRVVFHRRVGVPQMPSLRR